MEAIEDAFDRIISTKLKQRKKAGKISLKPPKVRESRLCARTLLETRLGLGLAKVRVRVGVGVARTVHTCMRDVKESTPVRTFFRPSCVPKKRV